MSTFKSSANLKSLKASTTKSVVLGTSSEANPTESVPEEQRWWSNKFRLGPSSLVTKRGKTSATSATFQTPTAGSAIISHVTFAPNAIKGHPYQMAIVSGPRVCLYGGTNASSLARALARTKAEEEEGSESLFGTEEQSVKPDRTVALGGHPAHHACYHRDGRLLVVGCDHGLVQICDSQSRATLRTFKTHEMNNGLSIRSVGWMPEYKGKKMIWSAGDDAILRVWDLSGDMAGIGDGVKPVLMMKGHGDAIRSAASFKLGEKGDEKLRLVTGSYDHTIRVWDCDGLNDSMSSYNDDDEKDRCLSVMDHGAPVESLIVLEPTAQSTFKIPLIVSAGGTSVKLWNPQIGSCISTIQTKHSKTITCVCVVSIVRGFEDELSNRGDRKICRRLMTAGLDGLIRIHSADELFNSSTSKEKKKKKSIFQLPFIHGVKTSLPITALAMSPDSTRLVIGSTTGFVTVKHRAKYVQQGFKRKSTYQPKAGTYSFFMRGSSAGAEADDHMVQIQKKKKLKSYDALLQKFKYGDALNEALAARDPRGIIAVLEELGRRRGLIIALSNRDEESLEPLLAFTATFISQPSYTPVLTGVADLLCDIYADVAGQSENIDEYFEKLHATVKNECKTQSILNKLIGQIDSVMYAAEVADTEE